MKKIISLIIGIIICSIGLFFIMLYLNLLTLGYSFFNFVKFIISNVYCDLFFLGLVIIIITIERMNNK